MAAAAPPAVATGAVSPPVVASPVESPVTTPKRRNSLFRDSFVNFIFGDDASGHEKLTEQLVSNKDLLSRKDSQLIHDLLDMDQDHLFEGWEPKGVNDDAKKQMMKDLHTLNDSYTGGILTYIARSRELLEASQRGENPMDGWTPSVPKGMNLDPETNPDQYLRLEEVAGDDIFKCVFVLVAGGLGERLGYGDIKIGLPSDTVTGKTYIELYCEFLKAYAHSPLVIMTSDDTHVKTVELLEANNYFGMEPEKVTLVKQGKVPALMDSSAKIALDGLYGVQAKPHGHGDVHKLVYECGKLNQWKAEGRKWVVFLQDTNGLGLISLPAMLGVSKQLNLDVNSATIPRKAKQEVGAIAQLTHTDGRQMTVNVEYNQLEPLLKATIDPAGDSADPNTGDSPFPGNINQLVFKLDTYAAALEATRGVMPEFVNPKYADSSRTIFSKPTRLECMMQDFPKLLSPAAKVGFTQMPAWLCFSPCKNSLEKARAAVSKGSPPACAAQAEADQYYVYAKLLRIIGCNVEEGATESYEGVPVALKPSIVFAPSFACTLTQMKARFPFPPQVSITRNAALICSGDVVIESLRLDGIAEFAPVTGDNRLLVQQCNLQNSGISFTPVQQIKGIPEKNLIRGYKAEILAQERNYKFTRGPVNTNNIAAPDGGCACTIM